MQMFQDVIQPFFKDELLFTKEVMKTVHKLERTLNK